MEKARLVFLNLTVSFRWVRSSCCLLIALLLRLHDSHAADSLSYRFSFGISLGGHVVDQKNVSDVLFVNGYRSVDSSDKIPDSSTALLGYASFPTRYPGFRLSMGYRWSHRMQGTLFLSNFAEQQAYFCNIGSTFKEFDNLSLRLRQWQADLILNYVLAPYPRKKKVGFQFDVSGGISFHHIKEILDFRLPDTSLSMNDQPAVVSLDSRKNGVSAIFGVEAILFLNRHFSISPARLLWSLPVLRPSFRAVTIDNGTVRRSLSGRNYDTGGWFYFIGAAYHF